LADCADEANQAGDGHGNREYDEHDLRPLERRGSTSGAFLPCPGPRVRSALRPPYTRLRESAYLLLES
jgi:hypothetical protein